MANTHSIDLESGSTQYLYAADSASLSITGDLTIEAWVKFESLTGGEMTIAGKYRTAGNQASYLFMWNDTGDNLQFFTSNDGAAPANVNVAWTPSTGVWYHVAVVYASAGGTADFYVNAVQQGTQQSGLDTSLFNSNARFSIGSYNTDDGVPAGLWDGKIDDVRLWATAKSQANILASYRSELAGNESNLNAYYKLNNATTDLTANANNLTAVGSPVFSTDIPFDNSGGAVMLFFT